MRAKKDDSLKTFRDGSSELVNEQNELIAVASGTYLVG